MWIVTTRGNIHAGGIVHGAGGPPYSVDDPRGARLCEEGFAREVPAEDVPAELFPAEEAAPLPTLEELMNQPRQNLQVLAKELGIEHFRDLKKEELAEAILGKL